tara:strand:- start:3870 stop:4130 length:261 start_codon:yes stop_codon:yes gene_type:complete
MDTTLKNKILLGSTIKAANKAKIYGQMCTENLSLIKIVLELKNHCELNLSYGNARLLGEMARKLQNKNKEICKYKDTNYNDKKFIN